MRKFADEFDIGARGFSDRLRKAVNDAGGGTAVSKLSGVALSTLNDYLKGNEAKFSKIFSLASACNVSLDWLATGHEGPTLQPQTLANLPQIGFTKDHLLAPVHYYGFFVLFRACREFHEKLDIHPSLAEALEWIAPHYDKMSTFEDGPVEFKPPQEIAP